MTKNTTPLTKGRATIVAGATLWTAFFLTPAPSLHGQGAHASVPPSAQTVAISALTPQPPLPDLPSSSSATGASSLPDAPQPQQGSHTVPAANGTPHWLGTAPLHSKIIPAGYRAQPITARDKVILGAQDLYSVTDFGAMFFSSGYSHVTNSEPNYGTDKGAYGQRLGAAAIRETSQGVFTDMVFAPLLHEDPRYYQLGSQYGLVHRTLYAITRPLVTRTDKGRSTINGSLLLGYAAAAAISPAYYPSINRNFHDTASTWGESIGGAAIGGFVNEFTSDVLRAVHVTR